MVEGKDLEYSTYTSKKMDNSKLSLGDSEEVTYDILGSGIDSGSSPYTIFFDFKRDAIKVVIRATVACSITEWNGKTLKSPMTVNPGANPFKGKVSKFKLLSSSATVVEVSIK